MLPQVDCSLRICHENVHAVFRVLLIFTSRFENEPLEDVIIPRYDAAYDQKQKETGWRQKAPYFQSRIVLESTRARDLRCGY